MVREHLAGLAAPDERALRKSIEPYLEFRDAVSRFQKENLSETCTLKCFRDRSSDCCGREGILTFFADVVVNVLGSTDEAIETLLSTLSRDRGGPNCVYLGDDGCMWNLKPIVCEMFLCDHAKEEVLGENSPLGRQWQGLRVREKLYTFPDRPVLFDDLENLFLDAGLESPLMYCHISPGLVLLKRKHGVGSQA